jgi:hypothetical protein
MSRNINELQPKQSSHCTMLQFVKQQFAQEKFDEYVREELDQAQHPERCQDVLDKCNISFDYASTMYEYNNALQSLAQTIVEQGQTLTQSRKGYIESIDIEVSFNPRITVTTNAKKRN